MRILQINSCHYRRGGADVVYLNTCEMLEQKGHTVFCFTQQLPDNEINKYSSFCPKVNDFRKGSFVKKVASVPSFIYNQNVKKKLKSFITFSKPEIAHLHLFLGSLSVSILDALNELNIPVISTIHDYRLLCPAYNFLDGRNKVCELCKDGIYLRCSLKRCSLDHKLSHSTMLALDAYYRKYFINPINKIDYFIFVSNFSRNKHIEFNQYYENKSSVLYNFNRNSINRFYSARGDYFLYIGRLSQEKGIDTLINAIQNINVKLKVVGIGPLKEKYQNRCYENIDFLGFKSGEALWELISKSSFVIVPSECYENNPMSIVEAFSFGKPVIGANVGSIPEIVFDSENGYVFEPRNIESLAKTITNASNISDEKYFNLSLSAFNFAQENFNPKNYYQHLINIYNCVIKNKITIMQNK